jgi:glutamate-ammonia-ligase adenylyltransferase
MKAPARKPRNTADTSLGHRIKAGPRIAVPVQARERFAAWTKSLSGSADGRKLTDIVKSQSGIAALMQRLADGSPYLWELVEASPKRMITLLEDDPDQRLARIIANAQRLAHEADEDALIMRVLRLMKADAALLIAMADIGEVWDVMRVTRALTDLADVSVGAALRFLLRRAAREGSLGLIAPEEPERGCGYVVLAMGKMGARELNYSSDIDLIVFFDPAAAPEGPKNFVRLTQQLARLLQERTMDGYVFRVDLRLRPDPASTNVAIAMDAALNYYESAGQNWERAALIKARPCAGDLALGERILIGLSPFVWRKYLDYVAVADVHAMKRDIHVYKGHGDIAVEGHNIKLGRGGIREIEFFVQTQQLVAGGRHPELRTRETLVTLKTLADGGWISADARQELEAAYRFLREVEHRLQMVADEQTHTLPADSDRLAAFARFLGFKDRDSFAIVLLRHLSDVQRHYAKLFETAPAADGRVLSFPPDHDDRETLDWLHQRGFRKPLEVSASIRGWLSGQVRATRSDSARQALEGLLPLLLDNLARSENSDAALAAFDRFLGGLNNGARFFALLRQKPDLLSLVALVLAIAPRLTDILAHRPQVIDPLIDPSFFGALPDLARLETTLAGSLALSTSDEDYLDRVRLFGQEQMFLIGVRTLSDTISAAQAGAAFADLAESVIRALHRWTAEQMAKAYGRMPGGESAVIAMGRLGSREMTATSDLDLIVIYDFDPDHDESEGARPMQAAQYFARLTQRLINALSAQTNHGKLYDVDLRLRPSGRSGPVATSLAAFETYQREEAWTWEHMALTRARVVSGSPAFTARIRKVIRSVLCARRDAARVAADVVDMRRAIASERGDDDHWDLKYADGGLVDVEFAAQYLQLVHAAEHPEILDSSTAAVIEKAMRLDLLAVRDADAMRPAVRLYHDLTQIMRLCVPGRFDPKTAGMGFLRLLARAGDAPDFAALDADVRQTQSKVKASAARVLARKE